MSLTRPPRLSADAMCGVCKEPWFHSDGNMTLCDTCSLWVHNECDPITLGLQDTDTFVCLACRRCRGLENGTKVRPAHTHAH